MTVTKAELKQMTWQEIKALAEAVEYEKPENAKWSDDSVIDKIVELKNSATSAIRVAPEVAKTITNEEKQRESAEEESKGKYATDYFKRNNIPYCDRCGAQHQNTPSGDPVCPENKINCPRLGGE